jgi:hypothetical protein
MEYKIWGVTEVIIMEITMGKRVTQINCELHKEEVYE